MKIGVLGSNGFVGSNIVSYLTHHHNVVPITRATIDLLDPYKLPNYLKEQKFDVIINAAASMTGNDSFLDTRNNLGLFMNFYNNSNQFKKFINLASGAEFDRTFDINCAREELIFDRMPSDSYGFGQNIKSRLIIGKRNFYNLRIFNCFGQGESNTRIFPRFIAKQNEETFEINNDRYFDYFSIQDLCKVVDRFVQGSYDYQDINCVYMEKYKISEVISMFSNIHNLKNNIVVVSKSENNYTGDGNILKSLGIELDGLEKGIKKYVYN